MEKKTTDLHLPMISVPGGKAGLGPFREELNEKYWEWQQNPKVMTGYGMPMAPYREDQKKMFEQQARRSSEIIRFTVYDLTGDAPVAAGQVGLRVLTRDNCAEFFMYIGEPGSRGKGVGTEAARLTLDYAFHIARIKCVYLTAFEPNAGAIRAYEKAGFKRQGVRRDSGSWLGRTVNEIHMDAIPEEFVGVSAIKQDVESDPPVRMVS
ncbi:GNAT family N-acetyltransferase [Rhodococcus qingshengii]|uniref:GNAT family N-acetyltransferase n=1 Tax=Rhodococcus qingshengii TaxID=334542 RepID=UPI0035D567B2